MKRPFKPQDFIAVPEDYVVGPPDFVGVGFGKTGTTWWHQLLLEHPAVKPNRLAKKELAYFYHFSEDVLRIVELFPEINLSLWPDL